MNVNPDFKKENTGHSDEIRASKKIIRNNENICLK